MPIYEYRCLGCDETFQELVSPRQIESGEATIECASCGSTKVERLLSAFAVNQPSPSTPGPPPGPCGSSCACFPR